MIVGVGVDIVEVARVTRMLARWSRGAERHLLTPAEWRYVRRQGRPAEHAAARIAAKEAVFKAFGDSRDGRLTWQTIEVVRGGNGRPSVRLLGRAQALLVPRQGVRRTMHVSLTHTHAYAVANALLVEETAAPRRRGRVR
jgi:holo-[acyl-carrier protein] synthase